MPTSTNYRDNVEEDVGVRGEDDDYSFNNVHLTHSLPALEEVLTENAIAQKRENGGNGRPVNNKLLGLIFISVFSLTAIIGLSVAISVRNSNSNIAAPMDKTPPGEDAGDFWERSPDGDVTHRHQEFANFLSQFAYTDMGRMTTPGTPQFKALHWLADEDAAELDVPASSSYEDTVELMQRFILAVFYYSTNGESWTSQLKFLSDYDVCYWNESIEPTAEAKADQFDGWFSGVQCNEEGDVNYLFIPENNLSGDLPPELGLLEAVMHFSAFGNRLTGSLPESLREWTDLKLFAVEGNMMSGSLPTWMSAWTNLAYLSLGSNSFTGPLPDGVFNKMPHLLEVSMHDNDFRGSFDKFGDNAKLETLLLHHNSFTGTIRWDTLDNSPLRVLDMSYNQIEGEIPSHFYDIPFVSLHNNLITGLAAPQEGSRIRFLSVYANRLRGQLPENIGDLDWLTHLDLSQNRLEGTIPQSINSCTDLVYLYLGDNEFSSVGFPSLTELINLQELSLRNMGITGPIPFYVGEQLSQLVFLDLSNNEMDYALPANLQNLNFMQFLLLNDNNFSGTVPMGLWQMRDLKVFALDGNGFSGSVGSVCRTDGPQLDWFVADQSVECQCCTEQCFPNDSACGGSTLQSPNIDAGYRRSRFIFSPELIFDASVKQADL